MRSTLLVILLAFSFAAGAQTAEEILGNYFTAIGGIDAVRNFKSSSVRGINLQHYPKKDTTVIISATKDISSFYSRSYKEEKLMFETYANPSGVTFYAYDPFPNKIEKAKMKVQQSLAHELLIAYSKRKLKKMADTTINDQPVYAVKTRLSKKDFPINRIYYFEKETSRLIACKVENFKGNLMIVANYEKHGDVLIPMTNLHYLNGMLLNTFEIQSIEVNPVLHDSLFIAKQHVEASKPKFKLNRKIEYVDPSFADADFDAFISTFKGKAVLIDLWASWCGPCKHEFAKYDDAYFHFLKTKNIEPVFISMDKREKEAEWKNAINYFTLSGHHIRAEKKLVQSLQKKFYSGGQMYIPRLILIGPNGEVLAAELPKLSSGFFYTKLQELLPSITP